MVVLGALLVVRLARVSARARSLPEALMALFFFGGVGGYAILMLRPTLDLPPAPLRNGAELLFVLAHVAVVLFTWRVFRPESPAARAFALLLVLGGVAFQLGSTALALRLGREAALATTAGSTLFWIGIALRAAGFGWAAIESIAYHGRARLQSALGLLDPLTANRFLLFACWSGMAVVLLTLRIFTRLVVEAAGPDQPAWLVLAQLVPGLVCVTAVWLTFAPPGFYRRRVLARAAH